MLKQEQANYVQTRNDIDKVQSILGTLKAEFNVFRIDTNHKVSGNKEELQE